MKELKQAMTRAIFALKSPPPDGSKHYQSGYDDGIEAAIEAISGPFEEPEPVDPDQRITRELLGDDRVAEMTKNTLHRNGAYTKARLLKLGPSDLLGMRHMGPQSFERANGLRLRLLAEEKETET